jgi:hypothetical protein
VLARYSISNFLGQFAARGEAKDFFATPQHQQAHRGPLEKSIQCGSVFLQIMKAEIAFS